MTEPSYPPARTVASRVHAHLAHQAIVARERGESDLAPVPDLEAVLVVAQLLEVLHVAEGLHESLDPARRHGDHQ